MTCIRAAWNGGHTRIAVAVGLILGIGGYILAGEMLSSRQLLQVNIQRIDVINTAGGEIAHTLQIEMQSSPTQNCTRTSQNMLYRDFDNRRFYYPVGSALNGSGFPGSRYDFTLVLPLPASLPTGDYFFIQRSAYICSWMGGFISRRLAYQTDPRLVHVGGN